MATMRDSSRKDWASSDTTDHLNIGALQRIADATEVMSQNYSVLIAQRNYWELRANELERKRRDDQRSIIALRGVITRMKRKAAK